MVHLPGSFFCRGGVFSIIMYSGNRFAINWMSIYAETKYDMKHMMKIFFSALCGCCV